MAALHDKVVHIGGTNGAPHGDTWMWDGSSWTKLTASGPSARAHAAMATLGGTVVLFGGNDGTKDLSDTWTWDGAAWTRVDVPGPSARSGAAIGTTGNTVLLFGGLSNGTALGDTWTWDGRGWTQTPQSAGMPAPAARSGAAATGP